MPAFSRDPLSVAFAPYAQRAIDTLLADPWHTRQYTVTSRRGEPVDAGGLSQTERALQRALYYALNSTTAAGGLGGKSAQNPDWSLMRGWGTPWELRRGFGLLPGDRKRTLWLTIVPKREARAAAARRPAAARWRDNAGLQSGGEGSEKRRFE